MGESRNVTFSEDEEKLSPWWRYGVLITILVCFGVLIWIAANTYQINPPVPERVVDSSGCELFSGQDIRSGQQVFLKNGLMDNGTIWGHGAYLGPDFSAEYLHQLTVDAREVLAQSIYRQTFGRLSPAQRGGVAEEVRKLLKENRYDAGTRILHYTEAETTSYIKQIERWRTHFSSPETSRGLRTGAISDPGELRQLTAFFSWAAWSSSARIPGRPYSYTNNFPYDPAAANEATGATVLWSALSLIALLAGTAAILFAFGRFDYLGWKNSRPHIHPELLPGTSTPSQAATLKFFVLAALLFLGQVLAGAVVAHFRADPNTFFGFGLAAILPSNLARTWHLQTAIFWIATAFVGGGLFLAGAMSKQEPKRQVLLTNLLFGALVVVMIGSLFGELLGLKQLLGKIWFWFGHQGWEYLEIGRAWQILLAIGLLLWAFLLLRGSRSALKDPKRHELSLLFLLAALAIPVFYVPAFFFGSSGNFTVVDTWRFWIIHLWVEGFFELFATTMVAVLFFYLGMVSSRTAKRVIYLDAILFLGSGIIGTGHHWYWTGQRTISMALSSLFSAMEVVPLILLTLDASSFIKLTKGECDICGKRIDIPHKWTFKFLIAVGVWNFVGAGIFGFLINLPIVSYYEAGTNLTPNHGHSALMGVFGMLAVAFVVFGLRQMSSGEHWNRIQKYIRVSFWGLNIGLALMVVLNLFPSGVLQLADVLKNGYWHARGHEFLNQHLIVSLEWIRLPADFIFIVLGVLPLFVATAATYWKTSKWGSKRAGLS